MEYNHTGQVWKVLFSGIFGYNRRLGASKKAVDSAIKSTKLNNTKLYAVNVIALGEFSVTQRDPRDIEWKKQVKELLKA